MRPSRWMYTIPLRLRSLFRRRAVEQDLDDEIRDHIERQVAANVAAGMAPADARTAALRAFGGVEYQKEGARDARGLQQVESVVRDMVHALRTAGRSPAFATVVVLSLALGIGAATTVFGLTWNVLLAPLAVTHPEQLVQLQRVVRGETYSQFSWAEFNQLRKAPGVEGVVATTGSDHVALTVGETEEYVPLDVVDGAFFSTIGVVPLRGRLITVDDDEQRAPVIVLSARLAERLFPRDSSPVGRRIAVRGTPFTVIGVTPASYRGLEYPGYFTAAVPLGAAPFAGLPDWRVDPERNFDVVARLSADPRRDKASLWIRFEACCATTRPGVHEGFALVDIRRGIPGHKNDVRSDIRGTFVMLLAGMGLVLVVVCCNIASLLVVRATVREREIGIRLSLGASRSRLVAQLVTESVPLAALGGLGGFLFAGWANAAFVRAMPPNWSDYIEVVRVSPGVEVFAFTAAITVGCVLAFALYPALRATRAHAMHALRTGLHATRTAAQGTVARGVVVAQVTVTVVLVASASLLTATAGNLARTDGGFAVDHVLLGQVETRGTGYERTGVAPLHEEILRHVRAIPSIQSAGMASRVPMYGGRNARTGLDVTGYVPAPGEQPKVAVVAITPGFFAASGIRLLSGRDFGANDHATGERVVVVNSALARRYFGDRDPLGQVIGLRDDSVSRGRIVGVAADAMYADVRTPASPMVYEPIVQSRGDWPFLEFVIRTAGEPLATAPALRRAVEAAAPGVRLRRITDMRSERDASMAIERFTALLAGFTGAMALVLAAVGLYGVVAYSVARRTSELGVRMALGATRRAIVWLVVRETLVVVAIGVVIGVPLSYAANSALASQLFGVAPHDPVTMTVSITMLTLVALAASAIPARRAARIDPRVAFNAE